MRSKMDDLICGFRTFAKRNVLIIIMLVFACPILAYSYSSFVFNSTNYRTNELFIGKLLYSIKIDGVSTSTVNVPANSEMEIVLQVTSLNDVSSNYKVVYNTTSGVTVAYASDDNLPAHGLITTIQPSTILITNSNSVSKSITFDVVGGYNTNELSEITAPTGKSLVLSSYMKYDYETVALFVDGVRVTGLDTTKRYNLSSSNCTNGETITYDKITKLYL